MDWMLKFAESDSVYSAACSLINVCVCTRTAAPFLSASWDFLDLREKRCRRWRQLLEAPPPPIWTASFISSFPPTARVVLTPFPFLPVPFRSSGSARLCPLWRMCHTGNTQSGCTRTQWRYKHIHPRSTCTHTHTLPVSGGHAVIW